MSNKLTYNIGFLLSILGTIGLGITEHVGGTLLTGILSFVMFLGYILGETPKD